MDYAYALGDQETTTFDFGLYGNHLSGRRTMSRLGRSAQNQLCAGIIPHHHGRDAPRRQLFKESTRGYPERLLGT